MNTKFLGYVNNQKETDEAFDNEGFLLTGGIGHFDEDGDLFVVERKKTLSNIEVSRFHQRELMNIWHGRPVLELLAWLEFQIQRSVIYRLLLSSVLKAPTYPKSRSPISLQVTKSPLIATKL